MHFNPMSEEDAAKMPKRPHPPTTGTDKRRTTVMLPSRIADIIKRKAKGPQTSAASVILGAHIAQQEALKRHYDTPGNRERVKLGLAPAIDKSLYDPGEVPQQVSLYLRYDANKLLTEAASAVGLSRRRYIAELVSLEFGFGQA